MKSHDHTAPALARGAFVFAGAAALLTGATPAPPALHVVIEVRRQSQDLLAAMLIGLYVDNRGAAPVTYMFSQADIFNVVAIFKGAPLWDARYGQSAVPVVRKVAFDRGKTLQQSYTWDGTATDRRSLPAGNITIRATLLTPSPQVATIVIPFAKPITIAQLEKVKFQTEATVEGEVSIRKGIPVLTDATGSIVLSRRLAPSAVGKYVARGFVNYTPEGLMLNVSRSAPAFENLAPIASPPPPPSPPPSPTPFVPGGAPKPTPSPA